MEDMEMKETMDAAHFAQFLRRCADALDLGSPVEMTLKGKTFTLNPDARFEVEFESEKGKQELEMEMKWRQAA